MPEYKISMAHCNACGGERNHHVLCRDSSRWDIEDACISGGTSHEMLKCAGCENVVLREQKWCSEDWPGEERETRFYPPATFRPTPKWLEDLRIALPPALTQLPDLLKEVYVALQNAQPYLAAMGIRALLEQIMIQKVLDNGSFDQNLKKFQEAGFVSGLQRKQLETVLEVGHAAIHRGYKPSEEDLSTIVDLTEVIVQSIYLHDSRVKDLKDKIPPRNTRGTS